MPVAEDMNCFTTRLKYRLEPKKLAQQRFDSIRIPSSDAASNCVPIRSPTLRNAERKLLNESKKEYVNRDTHSECPGLVYALKRR